MTAAPPVPLCSRCKVFPSTNKHPWCLECKAENAAANREAKLRQARICGFAEGVDAATEQLAREFQRLGAAQVRCSEVAEVIRRGPRPVAVAASQSK